MDLWQLDATDLSRLIRTGRASAREATVSCLARMDAVNGKLNAVVRRFDEEALATADAADAARARGEALGSRGALRSLHHYWPRPTHACTPALARQAGRGAGPLQVHPPSCSSSMEGAGGGASPPRSITPHEAGEHQQQRGGRGVGGGRVKGGEGREEG